VPTCQQQLKIKHKEPITMTKKAKNTPATNNVATGAAVAAAGVGLLGVGYTQVYAPLRARRLAKHAVSFREQHRTEHTRIDEQFNHQQRTVHGLTWHYVDEGARNGEAIVFLHGFPGSWYTWRYVLSQVDHSYRLIALDMKGYGRSEHQDPDFNWHTVAQQTLDVLDDLGIRKFYLVAHDWGSLIGSVLVGDHQERILGFVRMQADLKSPQSVAEWATFYRHKPHWLTFQNAWIGRYRMQDSGALIDTIYPPRMTTLLRPVDRDYLVYEFSRPGVAEAVPRYFLPHNWDLPAATDRICEGTFPFPVLQLQASRDPAQPERLFRDVALRCPTVRMEWIPGASHYDTFDQPTFVAEAINRFVHATAAVAHAR
jgi:pimeloyl-ACP methyl ester carboxylesterase